MRLFKRIRDLLQASIHDLLDGLENPQIMIAQLIRELDASILETRQQIAAATTQQKVILHRLEKSREDVKKWQANAELAVHSNRDDLAREALRRKHQAQADAESLQEQVGHAEAGINELREQLSNLADKTQEARRKRDTLLSRERPAPPGSAQQIIAGFDSFSKLEEAMLRSESAAEVDLDTEFDSLKRTSSLDAELKALKSRKG